MKCFTTTYSPLFRQAGRGGYWCNVPAGSIVRKIRDEDGYALVAYATNTKTYEGYIFGEFVERFQITEQEDNVLKITTPTPDESDAAQYILYKGHTQYNLCGELSVMYCMGWKNVDVVDWLDAWGSKSTGAYNRVFYGGRSRTTGINDLRDMLDAFDGDEDWYKDIPTAQEAFFSERLRRIHNTPGKWQKLLEDNRVIIGCKINRTTGRLQRSGILHWVAVEYLWPRAQGGEVVLYNPFSNSLEYYQWEQFVESTGVPYGLVIPR